MGGDEFVIIILPQYFNIWEKIVKNIIAMFRKPWYLMETEYFCTMSMGVAFFPDDGTEVDDIIKTADIAMYEAKKAGKNQYSIYDNTSSENVRQTGWILKITAGRQWPQRFRSFWYTTSR